MAKLCFIQKIIKDSDFIKDEEKMNFQLLKSLTESIDEIDVICTENNLSGTYRIGNILELTTENFDEVAYSLAKEKNYDLIISPDYVLSDVLYLSKHTIPFKEQFGKSKLEALFSFFFKEYNAYKQENYLQKVCTQKAKIIFTPSSVLKNDLINMYNIDGQKIYIIPPAVDMPKKIKPKKNQFFTFGFINNNFINNGGFVLLKTIKKLKDYSFKVRIFNKSDNIPKFFKYYIKLNKLENKIEFIDENIDEFYDKIDCLVMPSKHEAFGLPILEVMSRGKIALLSSLCGAKDIIEHDNNGFIFDITTNPLRNLKRAMEYILINQNDFENMQQKAIFTASVYNKAKFKDELLRIIDKTIKEQQE